MTVEIQKEIQQGLEQAYDLLAHIPVNGDNVERMANARALLRRAYKLAEPKEPTNPEAAGNGG